MNVGLLKTTGRVGANLYAVFWFGGLVLQGKDCGLVPAALRRCMSGGRRPYSHLGSTPLLSLDALGA